MFPNEGAGMTPTPIEETVIRLPGTPKNGNPPAGISLRTLLQAVAFLVILTIVGIERLAPLLRGDDEPNAHAPIVKGVEALQFEHELVHDVHLRQTIILEQISGALVGLNDELAEHRRTIE